MACIGITSKTNRYAAIILADRAEREKDGRIALYSKHGDIEVFIGHVFPDYMEPDSDLEALLAAEASK